MFKSDDRSIGGIAEMTGSLVSSGAFPIVKPLTLCRVLARRGGDPDPSGVSTRKPEEHPPAKAVIAITLIKIAPLT